MKYHNQPSPDPIFPRQSDYSDFDRREFLDAIDKTVIHLTEWENEFLSSTRLRKNFSQRQRISIDKMIEKYNDQVNW